MAISAAEEETLETIKRWWDESGKSLAIGLAVAAAVFFGWQQWQGMQVRGSAAASAVYENLTNLLAEAQQGEMDAATREQARGIIQTLKAEHGDSVYASYGALIGARLAVEDDDLALAEAELRWVLDNRQEGLFSKTDESLILTTQWRLGRVLLAQGDAGAARDLISGVDPKNFAGDFAELRGDIHFAQGELDEARMAWEEAAQLNAGNQILQMKLNSLNSGA